MIYPENIEVKLGFDKIRQLLKEECISTLGQAFVDRIQFTNKYDLIARLTQQTAEFCEILQQGERFPQHHYIDVSNYLVKAALEGAYLTESEFQDLKLSLTTIAECLGFFDKTPETEFPQLKELRQRIQLDKNLVAQIELIIDERGKMRDDASYELRSIRSRMINEQSYLRKRLDQIIRNAKQEGFTKEDAELTVRDGRLVIPVLAEHKRKIKGFVHDESATGQTVFLEPAEIIDINNEIRELKYQEHREMIRILKQLTAKVRPHVKDLEKAYHFLGMMDFIQAKAKFALKTESIRPEFVKKTLLDWKNARHPLLFLNFQPLGKEVVPLSIELTAKQRILLISGPNAGGKSVALKTVGLLQYMFQSGLLIPVDEDSTVGLFKDIFIDIGDEQSIDNDLSTYSSHLQSMKYFLKLADKYTLFLIDEFGTGTEPAMGGAIAQAILHQLNEAKAVGVITTHYTNLKVFAENQSGLVNGAMQFDAQNLEPLYQLEIGKPGSSFAFEIAQKIGLKNEVIQEARQHAGTERVNYDHLLRELEIEKKNYNSKNQAISAKEKMLHQVTDEYNKLRDYLDQEKKRILNQAKAEAQSILSQANQKIENTIREIKEQQAEREATRKVRQELEEFKQSVEPEPEVILETKPEPQEEIEVVNGEIQVGDTVRLKGQTALGEVLSIKGKDVEIGIGELKSNVKKNRLEKISRKEIKAQEKKVKRSVKGVNMNEKMANFSSELDVRGLRAEEAMMVLDNFMDDVLLLGQSQIRIVHGKGDGVLRQVVRDQLRKFKEVTSFQDEHVERGGDGVTIATLK